jgi:hypothetical protein
MKKILIYLLLMIPLFGIGQSLFEYTNLSNYRVRVGELWINGFKFKVASCEPGQLLRYDGTGWKQWTNDFDKYMIDSTRIQNDSLIVYQNDTILKCKLTINESLYKNDSLFLKSNIRFYISDSSKIVHWSDTIPATKAITTKHDLSLKQNLLTNPVIQADSTVKYFTPFQATAKLSKTDSTANTGFTPRLRHTNDLATKANLLTPIFQTNITTPLIIGGTDADSKITYKSTTGTGTPTGIAHQWRGGTNGATVIATILNNGNVGIGTTNPSVPLTVIGQASSSNGMILQSGAGFGGLKLGADVNTNTITASVRKLARIVMPAFDAGATNVMLFSGDITGANLNDIYFGGTPGGTQYAATGLHFVTAPTGTTTGGTERMTIDLNGNVGIGTTSLIEKLEVAGTISSRAVTNGVESNYLRLGTYSVNGAWGSYIKGTSNYSSTLNTNLYLGVSNNGTPLDAVTILSGGNVGIGTTTPTAVLHLKAGTATASTAPLKINVGTALAVSEGGVINHIGTTTNSTFIFDNYINSIATVNTIAGVVTKTTTGNPNNAYEGEFVINTVDNNLKVYADGEWRQLVAW